MLIKEENKQSEDQNILEESKNFEEELNKYKFSKFNGISQNKISNKQTSFGNLNSTISANAHNSSANKKITIKNFNSPSSESSKADPPVIKKFMNSKTNVNLKSIMEKESSNFDIKGTKKK